MLNFKAKNEFQLENIVFVLIGLKVTILKTNINCLSVMRELADSYCNMYIT